MFMSKFKYFFVMLFIAMLAGSVIVSCSDDDGDKAAKAIRAEGLAAGTEICNCMSGFVAPVPEDYFGEDGFDQSGYIAALTDYGWEASACLGSLQVYQEYVAVNFEAYDEEAENPLLSVFDFKNDDFKAGFAEGIGSCADTFANLLMLMQMQ